MVFSSAASVRSLFSFFALLLIGSHLLVGCGGDEKFAGTGNNTANEATPGTEQTGGREEPPSTPGKYGGTLTEDSISDPKTFNYWVAAETSSTGAVGPLYEPLLTLNAYTLKWEGRLAELPDVSADGLTWTFKLKPGLKWSDGQPITADDVTFTMDVIYDEKVQTNMRESMLLDAPDGKGGFKRVPLKYRKVDAGTVEMKFPVAYAPARDILSFPIAPRHKLLGAYKEGQPSKTRFNATWGINTKVSELVASGPWTLESYVPGQRLVYKRNPNFWKKDDQGKPLPYLDRYVTLIVPNLNTSSLKFRAGDTDVFNPPHNEFPDFKKGEAKGNYKVMNLGPSWGTNYLSLNMNPTSKIAKQTPWKIKLFRDARFRRAVSHAINRERIAKTVFLGLARPLYGPESPANFVFHNPESPKYPYDLEKSKALLAEIGLRDANNDKTLEFEGNEVKMNILTNVENNLRVAMATIISDDLRKVGINASFTPINFNTLVTKLDPKPPAPYDWDAIVLGFTGGLEPNNGRNIWQSSGNLHQWYPYQTKPDTKWETEIDELFRVGAQTMDEAKRKEIYNRWQEIVGEQQPLIYTVTPDSLAAVRNRFGNIKPSSLGGVLWNLEEIYDLKATRDNP